MNVGLEKLLGNMRLLEVAGQRSKSDIISPVQKQFRTGLLVLAGSIVRRDYPLSFEAERAVADQVGLNLGEYRASRPIIIEGIRDSLIARPDTNKLPVMDSTGLEVVRHANIADLPLFIGAVTLIGQGQAKIDELFS